MEELSPRCTSERIMRLMFSVRQRNPHFADDRVDWNDAFSGEYQPVPYHEQFDEQWKLFLERTSGFRTELERPAASRAIQKTESVRHHSK
jgi:hypothetical protein